MPWLVVIFAIPMLIGVGYFSFSFCETLRGKIFGFIVLGILVISLAIIFTLVCLTIACNINAEYILNSTPEEIIEIKYIQVMDDSFIYTTKDNITVEEYYLTNCISFYPLQNHNSFSRIEIYNGKWKSPIRNFLYGPVPTHYIIYLAED